MSVRKRLKFTWGNKIWIRDSQGIIRENGVIGKGNPKWVDYSNPPYKNTVFLREAPYPYASERCEFTEQIIQDYLRKCKGCITDDHVCFFTSGGTASGKTSAVELFLNHNNSSNDYLLIDYDHLKRALPEYNHMRGRGLRQAAPFVHHESSKIAGKLFKKAMVQNLNIIYEKTLAKPEQTLEEIGKLKKKKYQVFVIATHLSLEEGMKRAEKRFKQGGRHVPEQDIRDIYSSVPASLKVIFPHVDGLVLYNNEGPNLVPVFVKEVGKEAEINDELYEKYLQQVGSEFDLRTK